MHPCCLAAVMRRNWLACCVQRKLLLRLDMDDAAALAVFIRHRLGAAACVVGIAVAARRTAAGAAA